MRPAPTLRVRATGYGTLAFAVLLVLGSVLLVTTWESRLTEASDQLSRSRVDDLLALARRGDLPRQLRTVDDEGAAQVVGADGTVLAASPNLAGDGPVADLPADESARSSTFTAPDDGEVETYRFWYATGPAPGGTVTAYVGDSLESVSEASRALRRALWLGVPAVVALLCVVVWLVLGRVLGRLDRIRAEVDSISEENLHARVADDGVEDEVGRLAATMNAMLERLDTAARRQREFVADVSHDLRSPLAAQRVALEVALARPTGVDLERLRTDVLAATADMERLVDDLLQLASLDARTTTTTTASLVDLDDLVLEEAARARSTAGVRIDTTAVSAAPVSANADDVRRVVRNLLENAVAHARTQVVLTAQVLDDVDGPGGRWAQLLVGDDGPGVAAEHRDRIFDRFYRVEASRPRRVGEGGGSGLGLAIARDLAEHNGGQVDLVGAGGGTTMRLVLPVAR